MQSGLDPVQTKRLVANQPELLSAFNQWMITLRTEFAELVAERTDSPQLASAASTLALSSVAVMIHSPGQDQRPVAERLLATIDTLVAARDAELAPLS